MARLCSVTRYSLSLASEESKACECASVVGRVGERKGKGYSPLSIHHARSACACVYTSTHGGVAGGSERIPPSHSSRAQPEPRGGALWLWCCLFVLGIWGLELFLMLSALLPRLASATRHAASGWASPLVGAVAGEKALLLCAIMVCIDPYAGLRWRLSFTSPAYERARGRDSHDLHAISSLCANMISAATPLAWGRLWSAGHGSSVAQQVVRGLKTHSGTKKRFTKLPSGKFKRDKIGRVHLNTGTSGAEIRRGRRPQYANLTQEKNLQKLMPF